MKKVFFYTYPPGIHTMHHDLLKDPPAGYEFIVDKKESVQRFYALNKKPAIAALNASVLKKFVNTNALKDHYYRLKRLPPHDLLFSTGHLCLRKEPWVLELTEHICSLTGYDRKRLKTQRRRYERILASPFCKAILVPAQGVRKSVLSWTKNETIRKKMTLIPYAIQAPPNVVKKPQKKTIFLFIGSANITSPYAFNVKGGRIAIQAFNRLNRKDCELWIVSAIPEKDRKLCEGNPNIKVLPLCPREEVFKLYAKADASIQPTLLTPATGFIEAFAHALPIITTSLHLNKEMVEHLTTGIIAPVSQKWDIYFADATQQAINEKAERYNDDEATIESFAKALALAAEDRARLARMGRAARALTVDGPFSQKHRKRALKKVFDKALGGRR